MRRCRSGGSTSIRGLSPVLHLGPDPPASRMECNLQRSFLLLLLEMPVSAAAITGQGSLHPDDEPSLPADSLNRLFGEAQSAVLWYAELKLFQAVLPRIPANIAFRDGAAKIFDRRQPPIEILPTFPQPASCIIDRAPQKVPRPLAQANFEPGTRTPKNPLSTRIRQL